MKRCDPDDIERTTEERRRHQPWVWSGRVADNHAPIALGYAGDLNFFWSPSRRQVVSLTPNGLTRPNLMSLAPLQWWEITYPAKGKESVGWSEAINDLLQGCATAGYFDERRLAGRGVFIDGGRVVANLGDAVAVDGVLQGTSERPVMAVQDSRLVFQAGRALPRSDLAPLTSREADRLSSALELASWRSVDMARILAGWLVIAPMCGALDWRTHVWVTGARGSGKSFVLDFVSDILGQFCVRAQGATTEAGLRQDLGSDALPVVFDEADPKTEAATHRIDAILELARQASSSNSSPILKGGAGGRNMRFSVRSAFIFGSINHGLALAADQSRVLVLELDAGSSTDSMEERRLRAESFARLRAALEPLRERDFGLRLFRRTLGLMPTIRHNAEAFASALAERTGSRRQGDTLAAPLAGWFSLQAERKIDRVEAGQLLETWKWLGGAVERGGTLADHDHALAHLLGAVVRSTNGIEFTIGELLNDEVVTGTDSTRVKALSRRGMRIDLCEGRKLLRLANSNPGISELFRATPWARTWRDTLAQHPSAHTHGKPLSFGGVKSRFVEIDLDVALSEAAQ